MDEYKAWVEMDKDSSAFLLEIKTLMYSLKLPPLPGPRDNQPTSNNGSSKSSILSSN